jgi:hypothetical protein
MFAKSSEVGTFLKTICKAHNYCSYSDFVRRKLAVLHFHSAFQLSKRFQLSWRFISFMALYFSCIALSVPA